MPWWSWILIWVALVALALLFYVLLGIRLFRQFMATMKDLSAAGEKLGRVNPVEVQEATDPERALPGSAVFASPAAMRHDYEASKSARREERRRRRVQRKKDRGQPQALGDLDFT
ncbi:alkaline shock response membrane anchor protein AmaP [Pseudarthrobacter sp. Fe7]|nr:alkaline shock response membrane anchor protein AmaP [Pseudarthrobacter sp. Fe7]